MTTGSIFQPYGSSTPENNGEFYSKSWSGTDGLRTEEHPYTVQWEHNVAPLITWWLVDHGGTFGNTLWASQTLGMPTVPADVHAKLLSKLLDKARNTNFNLLVSAGEAGESARMLAAAGGRVLSAFSQIATAKRRLVRAGSVAAVRGVFNDLRRGLDQQVALTRALSGSERAVVRRTAAVGKAGGNLFLEYSYGWVPFLRDMREAWKLIREGIPEGRTTVRARWTDFMIPWLGFQVEPNPTSRQSFNFYQPNPVAFTGVNYRRVSYKCVVHPMTYAESLGMTDPISTLWELTALSFVFDWIYDVGSQLKALELKRHLQGAVVSSDLWKAVCQYDSATGAGRMQISGRQYGSKGRFVRSLSSGLDAPLSIRGVQTGGLFDSTSRTLTSLALTLQRLVR